MKLGNWKNISAIMMFLTAMLGIVFISCPAHAYDGLLAREQIILYGLGLRVEPEHQTVPKNIATAVATYLQAPQLPPDGDIIIPEDAEVKGTLRGPGLPEPLQLTTKVNGWFEIPPLSRAGLYSLEGIRVVRKGEVLFYATPENVTIEVIEKLLVTEVTTKPLTASEIKEKGIVFDRTNFQAYDFTAAFAVKPGEEIKINFPVILPKLAPVKGVTVEAAGIPDLRGSSLIRVPTIIPDTLKLAETVIPNLQVRTLTFTIEEYVPPEFEVPPIPGVIVIPGDIGFLNQYFSVLLMVANVAPKGSNLVVKDLKAELSLPPGNDTVVGTSDDPLRMAVTEKGEYPRVQLVVNPGPDGKTGTGDDRDSLAPGESGNAEFLVEGRREGTHIIEMEITGTLMGLPVGPVTVRGRAAGSVLVRNPSFTLTFTHPDIVNAGEEYDLDVTITNTSVSPANFVSINLYPRNISGATLVNPEDSTKEIEYIAPGDSATVSFRLRSYVTGSVFAATLDSDDKVAGRFQLKTSVGELGIPLSPDSLVLPKEAGFLPENLRKSAVALLGKAYATATAPPSALPPDVLRFSKRIVWDRAVDVAEAGMRHDMHEPLVDSVLHILMDFAGSDYGRLSELYPDENKRKASEKDFIGFDDIRRRSIRGDAFAEEMAKILYQGIKDLGVEEFHRDFAEKTSYRPAHLSVFIGTDGGSIPFYLSIVDDQGRVLGGHETERDKIKKEIPFSDFLEFRDQEGKITSEMALVSFLKSGSYTIKLTRDPDVPPGTAFTLSVVLPADTPSGMRRVVFRGITGADGVPFVEPLPGDGASISIEIYDSVGNLISGTPLSPDISEPVTDLPPSVISVVQQASADVLKPCFGEPEDPSKLPQLGRVVAVLFTEEVTSESVQHNFERKDITAYTMEENEVVSVALQPGKRIAFLALRDPVGPFIERHISIRGVTDLRGNRMAEWTGPVESRMTQEGAVVSGRILHPDGTPVSYADIRLFVWHCENWVGVSAKNAKHDGSYSWDWLLLHKPWKITAIDPRTGEFRAVEFRPLRHGQRLNIDIVFLGRATLKGRTFADDGYTPLDNVRIKVTSLTDYTTYGGTSDKDGNYIIERIPVGNIIIEAVHTGTNSRVTVSEILPVAGETVQKDLVLLPVEVHEVIATYGNITGHVLEADGSTPVEGVVVVAYYKSGSQEGVVCPFIDQKYLDCPVAMTTTDKDGAFSFNNIYSGNIRLYTFDQQRYIESMTWIELPPDETETVNILLHGGLGTVKGIVLDADGNPVSGAVVGGGFTLATADGNGQFVLTDVPVGKRDIVAVSNEIGSQGTATVDLTAEGEEVYATVVLSGVGVVTGSIYLADGITPVPDLDVYLWRPGEDRSIIVVATARTDGNGYYRMEKVPLSGYKLSAFLPDFSDGNVVPVSVDFNGQVVRKDIVFKGKGSIHGLLLDDDGVTPLKGKVSVSSLRVQRAGPVGTAFIYTPHVKIVETDLTGRFHFDNVFVGNFVLTAAGPFSPHPITYSGIMPYDGASLDVNMQLEPTSEIRGTVYQPDGVTPVGADVIVKFRGYKIICYEWIGCFERPEGIQEETVVTDNEGRYWLPLVNPGKFEIMVEDPVSGKIGQVRGVVKPGETAEVPVRLFGMGEVTVHVLRSDGITPVPGAQVKIDHHVILQTEAGLVNNQGYIGIERQGIADSKGEVTFAGGDALPEGEVMVLATDLQTGFAGRASGRIKEDGQHIDIKVYLYDAVGSVKGTIYRIDGVTPVPNAEVEISNKEGILAITVSDGDGFYEFNQIPLGSFRVDTFEPATGRRGSGTGSIDLANQEVTLNIFQMPMGYVTGTVYASESLEPLPNWDVELWQIDPTGRKDKEGNSIVYIWKATTGKDGSFSFPGISVGEFRIKVEKSSGGRSLGRGIVESRITKDGEVVDIPIIVDLIEEPKGTISGIVYNPDGTPGANTKVCIGTCNPLFTNGITTTDAQGYFTFQDRPLDRYILIAESQTTEDKAQAIVELSYEGRTETVVIVLSGLGTITGHVEYSDGSPASWAEVRLESSPPACDGPPCVIYADSTGSFRYNNVPSGIFTIDAFAPVTTYKGSVSLGLNPGEVKDVRIVIEPTGSVRGKVLFSDGRPASQVTAILHHQEKNLYIYRVSAADGTFTFPAVPTGQVVVNFEDPAGIGKLERTFTVLGDEDMGDLDLDDTRPTVSAISPSSGERDVALNRPIVITFSEPVLRGTVNQKTVRVIRDDGKVIQGIIDITSGDRVVTFTSLSPWNDRTRYSIRLNANPPFDVMDLDHSDSIDRNEAGNNYGVLVRFEEYDRDGNGYLSRDEYPEGIQDRYGHVMEREFSSSFTTVDITPPSIKSIDPAPGTRGVSVEGVIRVTYSEPVNPSAFPGPPIALTVNGEPVAGRVDMIFGNTGAVFTPTYPLAEDTVYHVEILPAQDLSGNLQPQGLSYDFTTTDRTPPVIPGLILSNGGVVVEGGVAIVTADTGPEFDVSFVDFYINGVLSLTDRQAPFEMSFSSAGLGAPGDTIKVSAIATDTSGNRGQATEGIFTIAADSPPVVTILTPPAGFVADTGSRVEVRVKADDDIGVKKVAYQSIGGQFPAFGYTEIGPPVSSAMGSFAFYVPVNAGPGSIITVKASALDIKGQEGTATPVEVVVRDVTPPSVSITGITTGEKVKPGDRVTALVTASDNGRISSITFEVSGATLYYETRNISPPQGSLVTSFTFTVSSGVNPGDTITLRATARDEAGLETRSAGVILTVADTIAPVVSLRTEKGSNFVSPGEVVKIIATATDQMGVTEVSLRATGAFTFSDTKQVSPPLNSAEVVFTMPIPQNLRDGDTISIEAVARDISNNLSLPAGLILKVVALVQVNMPPSQIVLAGDTVVLPLSISYPAQQGGLRIDLESENPSIADVPPSIVIPEGETSGTFTLRALTGGTTIINAYILGTKVGSMTVTVRGGVITGTVYYPDLTPAPGVDVSIYWVSSLLETAVTASDGTFMVEGIGPREIRIKTFDPATKLRGYFEGYLSAGNGYLRGVVIVLKAAGSISGSVFLPDGATPAGEGVRVDLYRKYPYSEEPAQTVFTNIESNFEFPLVEVGDYELVASDIEGNYGITGAFIRESGKDYPVTISFLGRGSVSVQVINPAGNPVPDAELKLNASSMVSRYAGYDSRSVSSSPEGTYTFDDVFMGSFSISARDPVTGYGASKTGEIKRDGEMVEVTLQVGAYASTEGTVYRADGVTVVPGAEVIAGGRRTIADENGRYRFDILPLGSYTAIARDLPSRGIGSGRITLSTYGETGQLDITMLGQGNLVVTVVDASDEPVAGASVEVIENKLYAYWPPSPRDVTGDDGVAVFQNINEGGFKVNASLDGLYGSTEGTLKPDETLEVIVKLYPAGIIEGTVYEPDGATPVENAQVILRYTSDYSWSMITGPDGKFRFESVPSRNIYGSTIKYTLYVYAGGRLDGWGDYVEGLLRAQVEDITIEYQGQVVTKNLVLIGLGTVTGRVLMPDSSSAPNMPVTIRSLVPIFGRTYFTKTNAAGYYSVEKVPEGLFTVTSGDMSRQLWGEGEGEITYHGETVNVDIILQNNAITLPKDLYDGNAARYDIQGNGTIKYGQSSLFTTSTQYGQKGGESLSLTVNGVTYDFTGTLVPVQEELGREIVVRNDNLGGLYVTRKVYVPKDGYFARYLEIITNPGTEPIAVDIHIRSDFYDSQEQIITTTSGDNRIELTGTDTPDFWVTVDDDDTRDPFINSNSPPAAFVWSGPGGEMPPDGVIFTPYKDSYNQARLDMTWNQVTILPGESIALMHFVSQQASREGAQASAERLLQLPPEALSGLSLSEIAMIKNFAVPQDGSSPLGTLPPLMGKVSGNILAGDGVTPVNEISVYLKSDNPFYARTYYVNTSNSYTFETDLTRGASGIGIPLDTFTVWAEKYLSFSIFYYNSVTSPLYRGGFAEGQDTTHVDIVFSNTGIFEGRVTKATGEPIAGATVIADDYNKIDIETDQSGSYRMTLLPPGLHTLKTTMSHPQGSDIDTYATGIITEGETTVVNLILPPLGNVTGILYNRNGLPMTNTEVYLTQGNYSWSTRTDTSGRFTFSEIPEGDGILRYYDSTYGNLYIPVNITGSETTTFDVYLAQYPLLPVELYDASGFKWDIQKDGRIGSGTNNAFYPYNWGGGLRMEIDGYSFGSYNFGVLKYGSRGVSVGPYTRGSLMVTRKVYVPDDDSFVRYLEIIENTGTTDTGVTIRISSYPYESGNVTGIVKTSSGDTSFTTGDRYIITDDADGSGRPAIVHLFAGEGGAVGPSEVSYTNAYSLDTMYYTFNMTVPAGGRRIIMHFASQNGTRADAFASAEHLSCLIGSALKGITDDEKGDIVNFIPIPDTDCDGLNDEQEVNQGTDPQNPDTDGDGLSDGFEVRYGLNPLIIDEDPDKDGLTNIEEQAHGTDPTKPDTDGDGFSDGYEVNKGSDPLNPASIPYKFLITEAGKYSRGDAMSSVDNQGNIHLVWTDRRDGNTNIYYKMLSPSGTVLIDDTRITTDTRSDYNPVIAVDSQGRVHIAWQSGYIYYTQLDPSRDDQDGSSALDDIIRVIDDTIISSTSYSWPFEPEIAVDSKDRIHIVWKDDDDGNMHYISLNPDGSVRIPEKTFIIGYYGEGPEISVDSKDNLHIVIKSYSEITNRPEIYYWMIDAETGTVLIDKTLISPDDGIDSIHPSISSGPDDIIYVAYENYRYLGSGKYWNEVFLIRLSPYLDDRDGTAADPSTIIIQPETKISEDDGIETVYPQIKVSYDGTLRLTYYDYNSTKRDYTNLHLLKLNPDGTKLSDILVSNSATYYSYYYSKTLQHVLTVDGITTYLAWTEEDETGYMRIYLRIIDPDRDRDLLSDIDEGSAGTDPANPDTDGDGLLDGFEKMMGLDPLTPEINIDLDGDGLTNVEEQTLGTSPTNPDTDGDGLTDGQEVSLGTDPLDADSDGDGITDGQEVNTYRSNPLNPDTDGDGLKDGVEVSHGLNPVDGSDASADFDNDGLTNSREIAMGTNLNLYDTDGDGLGDGQEVSLGTNPLKADTDGDRLTDGQEVNTYGSNPLSADTDGDGLTDYDEAITYSTSPVLADTDSGGRTDYQEIVLDGTDPINGTDDEVPIILSDGVRPSGQVDAVMDSEGNLHMVWVVNDGGGYNHIFYTMLSPDGTTLIDDTRISNYTYNAAWPAVEVDSQGRVHIVWIDWEVWHTVIDPSRDDKDGSPGDETAITVVNDQVISTNVDVEKSRPDLSADSSGRVHVVWAEWPQVDFYGEPMPVAEIHHSVIGTSGLVEVPDHAIFTGNSRQWYPAMPQIGVDIRGNAHIIWNTYDLNGDFRVHYKMLGSNGQTLIDTSPLSPAGLVIVSFPSIICTMNGQGNPEIIISYAATADWDVPEDFYVMHINPYNASLNGSPVDPSLIITEGPVSLVSNVFGPSLFLDSSGNNLIAWYSESMAWNDTGHVYFRSIAPDGNITVSQRQLTDGPTATYHMDLTKPVIIGGRDFKYILWTDNRTGTESIILRKIK